MFVTLVNGYRREPVPPAKIMPFIFLPPVIYFFKRMALKYLNDVVGNFEGWLVRELNFSDMDLYRCINMLHQMSL